MPPHPEHRDLAALDRARRMHLRNTLMFAIALLVVVALGIWRKSWPDDDKSDLAMLRTISGPFISVTVLVTFLFFLATALSHGSVVRKIAETQAVQAAVDAHRDLPPSVIAHMAAKAWHWRALCLSGGVMIASFSAMAALMYFHTSGYYAVLDIAEIALPVTILWSTVRFALAAMRFVRFAREQTP